MRDRRDSAFCLLRAIACGYFGQVCARRGRRCPAGAHAGAVVAARRLRCGARPGVASPNSLRSLRSLRSNRGAESVVDARYARRPQSCAPRRPRNRPRRAPPAATGGVFSTRKRVAATTTARAGRPAARLGGAEKRRACGLARSASCLLTRRRCPSAVSAANVASSAPGPQDRASQGSRCAAPAASAKRRGPARTRRCRPDPRAHCARRTPAMGSKPTINDQPRFKRRGLRDARWSS